MKLNTESAGGIETAFTIDINGLRGIASLVFLDTLRFGAFSLGSSNTGTLVASNSGAIGGAGAISFVEKASSTGADISRSTRPSLIRINPLAIGITTSGRICCRVTVTWIYLKFGSCIWSHSDWCHRLLG